MDYLNRYCTRCGKALRREYKTPRMCPRCRNERHHAQPPKPGGLLPHLTPELAAAGFTQLTNPRQFRAIVSGHTIDLWPSRQRWTIDWGKRHSGPVVELLSIIKQRGWQP